MKTFSSFRTLRLLLVGLGAPTTLATIWTTAWAQTGTEVDCGQVDGVFLRCGEQGNTVRYLPSLPALAPSVLSGAIEAIPGAVAPHDWRIRYEAEGVSGAKYKRFAGDCLVSGPAVPVMGPAKVTGSVTLQSQILRTGPDHRLKFTASTEIALAVELVRNNGMLLSRRVLRTGDHVKPSSAGRDGFPWLLWGLPSFERKVTLGWDAPAGLQTDVVLRVCALNPKVYGVSVVGHEILVIE